VQNIDINHEEEEEEEEEKERRKSITHCFHGHTARLL
jgi:hypothetical protein